VDASVAAIDEPDEDRRAAGRLAREPLERVEVVLHEHVAQDEVLGRITGDRELGEDDDVDGGFGRPSGPLDEQVDVAFEIADRGVDLAERDAHHRRSA
jgi:hypothetical protein